MKIERELFLNWKIMGIMDIMEKVLILIAFLLPLFSQFIIFWDTPCLSETGRSRLRWQSEKLGKNCEVTFSTGVKNSINICSIKHILTLSKNINESSICPWCIDINRRKRLCWISHKLRKLSLCKTQHIFNFYEFKWD